ncbi:hypothetical protein NQ318_013422 [Aromia moschata]|uniref:Uncharacterized protein n=1 Tax=Aromia moschata TaxID=1265417 RepID=A0AAV8YP51_9CUCU|nr:hypothetical protein NQ318_013422 [Aromia moschata]
MTTFSETRQNERSNASASAYKISANRSSESGSAYEILVFLVSKQVLWEQEFGTGIPWKNESSFKGRPFPNIRLAGRTFMSFVDKFF